MNCSKVIVTATAAGFFAVGCAVGPNYKTPRASVPAAFDPGPASPAASQPSATQPSTERAVDLRHWWMALDDPELNSLVDRAVRSNLDLKIALTRLQEARTNEYVVNGGTLPVLEFSAGAARGSGSDSTRGRITTPLHSGASTAGLQEITHAAGFDATWEIDLFGRFRREIEAAQADTQAAAEARNAVLISLVAEVARAYTQERALSQRLAVAVQNLNIQSQSLDVVTKRYKQGITNELDVSLAQRQLATVQSTIAPLKAAVAQAQRRVAVLLGLEPQELYAELQRAAALPNPPERIEAGMPIDLLRRRPDVRQAERELAASTARLGVATANLFPRVALIGSFGFQGQGLGRVPVTAKDIWSLGPTLYWPVLDFGTLDAIVQFQDLRTQERLYNYRQTVLSAVEEVDNAIGNYIAERDRLDQLNQAVVASEHAVKLATQRYERGLTIFLDVLDAQRQLFQLQDAQAVAQQDVVIQFISLYKSLGGGWEDYQSVPSIRQPRPAIFAAGQELFGPKPK